MNKKDKFGHNVPKPLPPKKKGDERGQNVPVRPPKSEPKK